MLGAGFSKSFGIPLAQDFIDYARRLVPENGPGTRPNMGTEVTLRPFVRFADRVGLTHIEKLLRCADTLDREARWNGSVPENLRRMVVMAIFDILREAQADQFILGADTRVWDAYLGFLSLAAALGSRGLAAPIVSLNYDTVLECVLDRLHRKAKFETPRDFAVARHVEFAYGGDITSRTWASETGKFEDIAWRFPYWKVHGAINWESCPIHGYRRMLDDLASNTPGRCEIAGCKELTSPLIAYPDEKEGCQPLWKCREEAWGELGRVRTLVVIGVAFSGNDEKLLTRVQKLANAGTRIVVVDPSAVEIAKRISGAAIAIGPPSGGSKFLDVFGEAHGSLRREFEGAIGVAWGTVKSETFFRVNESPADGPAAVIGERSRG